MNNRDTIDTINTLLVEAMSAGRVPWAPEWWCTGTANAISGHGYRGINSLILPLVQADRGFKSSLWVTFNQARNAGGKIRAGERGTKVYFWKFFKAGERTAEVGDQEQKGKLIPFLKIYTVFNLDQTEGIEQSKIKQVSARNFPSIENYANGPHIVEDGSQPRYTPGSDTVYLPTAWKTEEGKYQVTYHELAHSTGHKSRLDRDLSHPFGSKDYAREELVAEMASAYACALTGKPWIVSNSASYLSSWVSKVKEDPMILIWASGRAEKAADMILGIEEAKEEEATQEPESMAS